MTENRQGRAAAAIANAVGDVLSPFGIEINSTPVRPDGLLMRMPRGVRAG